MLDLRAVGSFAQILLLAISCAVPASSSADERAPYEPTAPYVPTVREDVELMLDVADVRPGDYVIDLGSGDGRIVIAAARRGAFGHGVEIEPELVDTSRRNAREAGVSERTAFVEGDIFETPIADASVVTLYLFPEVNIALRPKLLAELAPGTRIVSNSFDMGDWRPDLHDMSARSSGGILLWIVPARVDGARRLEIFDQADPADGRAGGAAIVERHALGIAQTYQNVEIALQPEDGGPPADAIEARPATLRGDRITFLSAHGQQSYAFGGRVDGDAMDGYVQIRNEDGERLLRWRATR